MARHLRSPLFSVRLFVILFLLLFLVLVTVLRSSPAPTDGAWLISRMTGPLPYDDQDLLQHLRSRYLVPPSTRFYNLTKNTKPHSTYNNYRMFDLPWKFYRRVLQELFTDGGISEGERFFVEAGALDGEFLSNTLYLEEELGWTGLLVEPDNDMFLLLQKKHRRAWSTYACLSGTPYPHSTLLVKYIASKGEIPGTQMYARAHGQLQEVEDVYGSSDIGRGSEFEHHRLYEKAQCLPLGSLLLALNITTVDVVSLDLEGAEEGVLATFPWDHISVRVWLIENVNRTKYKQAVESPGLPREEDVRSLSDEMTEGKSSEKIASKTKVYLQENLVSGGNEEERGEIISDQKIPDDKLTPAKDFGVRGSGNQRVVPEESVAERESDKSKSCDKSKDDKMFDPVAFFADKGYSLFATHQLFQNHDHVFVKKEFLVKERKVD